MGTVEKLVDQLKQWFSIPLLNIGKSDLTLWTIVSFVVLVVFVFQVSGFVKRWIIRQILMKSRLDLGLRETTGTIVQYVLIVIGLLIIFQSMGIDFTTLNILAGTIGVGLGFGLQNIVNNFVSGLIILFERPIQVGDRIEVGVIEGDVIKIGARSTTVLTNDNIAIIVPNSRFITESIVNWSHKESKVRFRVPVAVAYDSDVRKVERLLLDVALENPDIIDEPAPVVRFMEFMDSSLKFELRAWSTTLVHRKGKLISSINFAIFQKFRESGIEMPYPQRDLHIRSMPENRGLKKSGASDGEV
jgi:small-conductance mechanosensitive channel